MEFTVYDFMHLCYQNFVDSGSGMLLAIMQVFVMMVGELNYQENILKPFLEGNLPFPSLTYAIFVIFTFAVPILLMNLMVSPKILQEAIYLNSHYQLRMLHCIYVTTFCVT